MTNNFKAWMKTEWPWVGLILVAILVCYFRFPELQNDDHLDVIRYIARTGEWPQVQEYRSSMHILVYHTVSAELFKLLEYSHPILGIRPLRAGQLVNLVGMIGITLLLVPILRSLIQDLRARILALMVFGSSTRIMTASVTIDNDILLALMATLALWLIIRIMQQDAPPTWQNTLALGALLGAGILIKENGQQFFFPVAICYLVRYWTRGDKIKRLLLHLLLLVIITAVGALPSYLRHHHDTGQWIYHDQGFHQGNWSGTSWDFFSFRFSDMIQRPFIPYGDFTDERLCPADTSWPSKLYMNWWSLPDFLPDRPNPYATRAIFFSALPLTSLFLMGFVLALGRVSRDQGWLPALGWPAIIIIFMVAASFFFPEPRYGCHAYPRHIMGGIAGLLCVFALAVQTLGIRWPWTRKLCFLLVGIHLVCFWWLLLDGPFYSFLDYPGWPGYHL